MYSYETRWGRKPKQIVQRSTMYEVCKRFTSYCRYKIHVETVFSILISKPFCPPIHTLARTTGHERRHRQRQTKYAGASIDLYINDLVNRSEYFTIQNDISCIRKVVRFVDLFLVQIQNGKNNFEKVKTNKRTILWVFISNWADLFETKVVLFHFGPNARTMARRKRTHFSRPINKSLAFVRARAVVRCCAVLCAVSSHRWDGKAMSRRRQRSRRDSTLETFGIV